MQVIFLPRDASRSRSRIGCPAVPGRDARHRQHDGRMLHLHDLKASDHDGLSPETVEPLAQQMLAHIR